MQALMDAAEAQEAAGDAIEGVWLRRLRSLVEHKGTDWVLRALGGVDLGSPHPDGSERLWKVPTR